MKISVEKFIKLLRDVKGNVGAYNLYYMLEEEPITKFIYNHLCSIINYLNIKVFNDNYIKFLIVYYFDYKLTGKERIIENFLLNIIPNKLWFNYIESLIDLYEGNNINYHKSYDVIVNLYNTKQRKV